MRNKTTAIIVIDAVTSRDVNRWVSKHARLLSDVNKIYLVSPVDIEAALNEFIAVIDASKVTVISSIDAYHILETIYEIDESESSLLVISPEINISEESLSIMIKNFEEFDRYSAVTPYVSYGAGNNNAEINKINDYNPLTVITPVAESKAILINRKIFNLLFEFVPKCRTKDFFKIVNVYLYHISRFGYSCVVDHRAVVFSSQPGHKGLSIDSYSDFPGIVSDYTEYNLYHKNPLLGHIIESAVKNKKSILFDISRIDPVYNGTSEHTLNLLRYIYPLLIKKFSFSILINFKAEQLFGLSKKYENVIVDSSYPTNVTYDLVYTPFQIFSLKHLFMANRIAVKHLVGILDIISLRCYYLKKPYYNLMFRKIIDYCDGIIVLSEYAKKDLMKYFSLAPESGDKIDIIPPSKIALDNRNPEDDISLKLPKKYVFVVGNKFAHKCVINAIKYIPKEINIVLMSNEKYIKNNIISFKSGNLSDSEIETIYTNSSIIVFPSLYEGFGIPILASVIYKKPIILFDSLINREITEKYKLLNAYYFSGFFELGNIINQISGEKFREFKYLNTWDEAADKTCRCIEQVINSKPDYLLLDKRFNDIVGIELLLKTKTKNKNVLFGFLSKINKRIKSNCKRKYH
jgi:hypothetical protein